MSQHPDAAAIIAAEVASETFTTNPAEIVARYTGWAADAATRLTRSNRARIRRDVHVACGIVAAAGNPAVKRGAVLEDLVARFGDGLEP